MSEGYMSQSFRRTPVLAETKDVSNIHYTESIFMDVSKCYFLYNGKIHGILRCITEKNAVEMCGGKAM
ncbi:MAG: hypothetical protein IKS33_02675 [Bacteroidales bacterium]|nr:hypothetical protein [Bacteroidales bacterium]MBR4453147.1 hypothetical protein [Bacteroidales bacterium]